MKTLKTFMILAATVSSLGLVAGDVAAAPFTTTYFGTTTADITDGANAFGLGTSIIAGTAFSLAFNYDTSLLVPGQNFSGTSGICGSGCNFSAQTAFTDETSLPRIISSLAVTFGGSTLVFDPDALLPPQYSTAQSISALSRFDPRVCTPPAGGCFLADFTESSSIFSQVGVNVVQASAQVHYDIPPNNTLAFPGGEGRLTSSFDVLAPGSALLVVSLLADDSTPAVDFDAGNALALSRVVQGPAPVPVPAALPMFIVALAGVGGLSRLAKKRASR